MRWTFLRGNFGLAALLIGDTDAAHCAARLAGAAAAHGDGSQQTALPEPTRRRHGPALWDAAVREGASLGFDEAIAYALQGAPLA